MLSETGLLNLAIEFLAIEIFADCVVCKRRFKYGVSSASLYLFLLLVSFPNTVVIKIMIVLGLE